MSKHNKLLKLLGIEEGVPFEIVDQKRKYVLLDGDIAFTFLDDEEFADIQIQDLLLGTFTVNTPKGLKYKVSDGLVILNLALYDPTKEGEYFGERCVDSNGYILQLKSKIDGVCVYVEAGGYELIDIIWEVI